jgi:chaperonin GroES
MIFEPIHDRIFAKKHITEEQKTEAGIIIPETSKATMHETAEVFAVGDQVSKIKKGDTILYPQGSGTVIFSDGQEMLLLREEQIDGVSK